MTGAPGRNFFDASDGLWAGPSSRSSTETERCRAARYVATRALDAADAAHLLEVLGLAASEGLEPRKDALETQARTG